MTHDADWEDANRSIIEIREDAKQAPFPAMEQLAAAVRFEIEYQKGMWQGDYVAAFDAARDVLGILTDGGLRGYRALWHYLAGSAAEMAAKSGSSSFRAQALDQFREAKKAATGIPWLVSLAQGDEEIDHSHDRRDVTLMLQIEKLEARLVKLGKLHNRVFSAKEKEIRDGLAKAETFEQGQKLLGEHLGFMAGKVEDDASPDPWWVVGEVAIVFEDHANAKGEEAIIDATKARQAASHLDWMRAHVPGADSASIIAVLVTPAKRAFRGAMPSLGKVVHWDLKEFREWAEQALTTIRELRRTFVEPGDLEWRARAAEGLVAARAAAPVLFDWLSRRPADKHLLPVEEKKES